METDEINQKLIISEDEKVLKCLSKLNDADIKCLIVVDKKNSQRYFN